MSDIVPLLTFRAGRCTVESTSGNKSSIKVNPTPGYVYIYTGADDELTHFCWRERSQTVDQSEFDLIMFPGDASFTPYTGKDASSDPDNVTSPTNGRIFVLKFSSSSQRHLFWLQSKSQHPDGKLNWFSPRDLKIGQIVDLMLRGEEVNVEQELSEIERPNGNSGNDDQDMEDLSGSGNALGRTTSTGGAGANATGGDIRDEGEESREGGADGGRA